MRKSKRKYGVPKHRNAPPPPPKEEMIHARIGEDKALQFKYESEFAKAFAEVAQTKSASIAEFINRLNNHLKKQP
jgi:hypothetical protein